MSTTPEQEKANTDNRSEQMKSNNEKYDKAREGNTGSKTKNP